MGLLDPRRLAASKPLTDHLADFKVWLATRGITSKQVELVAGRAARIVNGCGLVYWTDVQASKVERFLARARIEGFEVRTGGEKGTKTTKPINAQTSNFYLQAIQQFARWMVRDGRASESPLAHVAMLSTRADRKRIRRALTLDEVRKLLIATHAAPFRFGMAGPERALVYRLAIETGRALVATEERPKTRQPDLFDALSAP